MGDGGTGTHAFCFVLILMHAHYVFSVRLMVASAKCTHSAKQIPLNVHLDLAKAVQND